MSICKTKIIIIFSPPQALFSTCSAGKVSPLLPTFLGQLNFPEWSQLPGSSTAQSHSMHTPILGPNNLKKETAMKLMASMRRKKNRLPAWLVAISDDSKLFPKLFTVKKSQENHLLHGLVEIIPSSNLCVTKPQTFLLCS